VTAGTSSVLLVLFSSLDSPRNWRAFLEFVAGDKITEFIFFGRHRWLRSWYTKSKFSKQ
jgi:hypothetical protein